MELRLSRPLDELWGLARGQRDLLVDRAFGTDPGLMRLRQALRVSASIVLSLGLVYVVLHLAHAFRVRLPAGAPASVRAAAEAGTHGLVVITMLMAALCAMVMAMSVHEARLVDHLRYDALIALAYLAGLAVALELAAWRPLAVLCFPLAVVAGLAVRRVWSWATFAPLPLLNGTYVGFLLHGDISFSVFYWPVLAAAMSALLCTAVGLGLFRPDPAAALRRCQVSWSAGMRRVARLAARDFAREGTRTLISAPSGRPGDPMGWAISRAMIRLNQMSLIIDAHLAAPGSLPEGSSAQGMHERLFDAELGITNAVRFPRAWRNSRSTPRTAGTSSWPWTR